VDFYGGADASLHELSDSVGGVVGGGQQFNSVTALSVADDNTFDWGQATVFRSNSG